MRAAGGKIHSRFPLLGNWFDCQLILREGALNCLVCHGQCHGYGVFHGHGLVTATVTGKVRVRGS